MEDKPMITIPLEEYKELLNIKGRYEELKNIIPNYPCPKTTITYRDFTKEQDKDLKPPYKVTC